MEYQKFEYKRIACWKRSSNFGVDNFIVQLNEMGNAGWECVGYSETDSDVYALLRRPIFEKS